MSTAPLIGITTYGPESEGVAPAVSLPIAYAEAVARAGGIPLLLPPITPIHDRLLDLLDGLILSGGGDIDPKLHTERVHETVYMITPQRDHFELELARRALERPELAVLGICRGMQVMNVALGGDLELHLPDVRGERVAHRAPPRIPVLHDVELIPGSAFDQIYTERHFPVCSWHHQEIHTLGRDLVPAAHAADGVIEAVAHTRHPFALGVQWHPEMQADDPRQRRLFEAFVERARRGK
jgi:putative glutamine amidotransferase